MNIIESYKMNALEKQAYEIGLLWIAISKKMFPNYNHTKGYPNKGDPRKSVLFKYCYKLVKETKDLIKFEHYKFYIKSQLDMLSSNVENPVIDPSCLVGDNAWIRWKIWKKEYEKRLKNKLSKQSNFNFSKDFIINKLKSTYLFLKLKFNNNINKNIFIQNKDKIERWASYEYLDIFYLILSPWVNEICNLNIDKKLYEKCIDDEIKETFKQIFKEEFK